MYMNVYGEKNWKIVLLIIILKNGDDYRYYRMITYFCNV